MGKYLTTEEAIKLCEKNGISREEFYNAAINGDLNPFIVDENGRPVKNARVTEIDYENDDIVIQELDD